MLIKPREYGAKIKKAVRQELRRAHKMGPVPDPVCSPDCPEYNPARNCHRNCAFALTQLSTSAKDYPLEKLVAPLVFELKKLGVFYPCWSCEGHNDASGALWKIPRVWFYSDSVVHLRALGDAVHELHVARQTYASWKVTLTFSHPENPDTAFSLEPRLCDGGAHLADLQKDLDVISERLPALFYQACDQLHERAR